MLTMIMMPAPAVCLIGELGPHHDGAAKRPAAAVCHFICAMVSMVPHHDGQTMTMPILMATPSNPLSSHASRTSQTG